MTNNEKILNLEKLVKQLKDDNDKIYDEFFEKYNLIKEDSVKYEKIYNMLYALKGFNKTLKYGVYGVLN